MRGRKPSFQVILSDEERQVLESWRRSTSLPAGKVLRARVILFLSEGLSITETGRRCGMGVRIVRKWGRRFVEHRLDGLNDLPRPGRKPVFSP